MRRVIQCRAPVAIVLMVSFAFITGFFVLLATSIWVGGQERVRSLVAFADGSCCVAERGPSDTTWYDTDMQRLPTGSPLLRESRLGMKYCVRLRGFRYRGRSALRWRNTWRLSPVPGTSSTWDLSPHRGRLEERDQHSHRLIGTLGPDGYRPGPEFSGPRFEQPIAILGLAERVLVARDKVFSIDRRARTATPLFEIPDFRGARLALLSEAVSPTGSDVAKRRASKLAILAEGKLKVVSVTGTEVFEADAPPGKFVELAVCQDGAILCDSVAVDSDFTQRHAITLYGPDGSLQKSCQVQIPQPSSARTRWSALIWMAAVVPPAVALIGVHYPPLLLLFLIPVESPWFGGVARLWIECCVGTGLLCAPILWLLASRDGARARNRVGWAVFGLSFSIVGVLTYLGLRSRPVREPCPSCGRKRPVDVPQCPSCASPFPEPELTGTEVFDYAR